MNPINQSYEFNKCQYMYRRCMSLFFVYLHQIQPSFRIQKNPVKFSCQERVIKCEESLETNLIPLNGTDISIDFEFTNKLNQERNSFLNGFKALKIRWKSFTWPILKPTFQNGFQFFFGDKFLIFSRLQKHIRITTFICSSSSSTTRIYLNIPS